jgi:hypothetical protein
MIFSEHCISGKNRSGIRFTMAHQRLENGIPSARARAKNYLLIKDNFESLAMPRISQRKARS